MDTTIEGTPPTPTMSDFYIKNSNPTPTPTPNPIGLDMAVFHIPDNETMSTILRCDNLLHKIDGNKADYQNYKGGQKYNKKLCDALLDTLEKATTEMTHKIDANADENPIPTTILNVSALHAATSQMSPHHTVTSHDQYEDISSTDTTPKLDIKDVTELIKNVQAPHPEPEPEINPRDAEVVTKDIMPTPMFATLTVTNNSTNHNVPHYKTPDTLEPYKSASSTWYHVEECGTLIQVTENGIDTQCTTQAGATPVQDELQPPYNLQMTPLARNMEEALVHATKDSGTMTNKITTDTGCTMTDTITTNTGCDPRPTTPRKDQSTSTLLPKTVDCACSPIKDNRVEMGTDPIPWWLINTRQYLKQ
jgi:hypothetical protein